MPKYYICTCLLLGAGGIRDIWRGLESYRIVTNGEQEARAKCMEKEGERRKRQEKCLRFECKTVNNLF